MNMDNGGPLRFSGENDMKYADVVLGGEGMTMIVRITGRRDSKTAPPFMVFKNKNRSYPIRGSPDDIAGAAYRTEPKMWMEKLS